MDAPAVPALPPELAEPSEIDLLSWVSNRVTPAMLEEIAQNDRGEEAAEHLAGIRAQLRARAPLGVLPWNPREVLELERWSEPEKAYSDRPPEGLHGHWKRLLACTILLRNVGHVDATRTALDEDFFVEASAVTVIQLVRSARVIGGEAPALATRFLLWLYQAQAYAVFRPYAALGVVLLTVHCANLSVPRRTRHSKRRPSKPLLVDTAALCSWMVDVEAAARESLGEDARAEVWLFGLDNFDKSKRHLWTATARSILVTDDARDLLGRLASIASG